MVEFVCDKEQSLKEYTDAHYAQASFAWEYLLKNKEIKVNGKKVGENVTLQLGDKIQYYLTKKQAEKPAFYVVYEDENVLVIDKESGVNSEAVFSALSRETQGKQTRYFIHRLDRNTRGLMVFAKNEETERALLNAFKERKVEKRYHAVCFGRFERQAGVLTAYLEKNEQKSFVKIFDKPKTGAEKIVTEYKVLETRGECVKAEILLHTGKTHQIRAHLAHVGCPIVGDEKYGNHVKNRENKCSRQCLVAKFLRFSFAGKLAYLNEKIFRSRFDVELLKEKE